jgi:hypothetical protein
MIIVTIWWYINNTDDDERAFMEWWRSHAKIHDRTGLLGEFLSRPNRAEDSPFRTVDLRPSDSRYRPFTNVGLWRDEDTFYQQVGQYFSDNNAHEKFEFQRRDRIVMKTEQFRMGSWSPPAEQGVVD